MSEPKTTSTSTSAPDGDLVKVRLKHKLAIKRIVIDRLLIGLLIGVAGFIGNLLIERFKADMTEYQFFMEQRHTEATGFRTIFSKISNEAMRQTEFACLLDHTRITSRSPLEAAVSTAVSRLDSCSLLFSREYLVQMDRVLNIFGGAAAEEVKITCDHRLFFAELADYVTHLTRQEVFLDNDSSWNGFVPESVSREGLEHMGSIKYHNLNFRKWQTLRKPEAVPIAPKSK